MHSPRSDLPRHRHRSTTPALVGLWLLAGGGPAAWAQDETVAESAGYWSIQFENDYLGGKTDQHYTQGLELSLSKRGEPPAWLTRAADRLPTYESSKRSGVTYSLGQKIFTPEDIETSTLIADDRPYAGYLYGAVTYMNSIGAQPDLLHVNVLELTLGVVGPSALAEPMQNSIHNFISAPIAQGWAHQLHDELGLGASYVHKWRIFEDSVGGTELEVSPHTVVTVGNVYTYLGGGVMFRWGRGLRRDMGPPSIRPGFVGSAYFVPRFAPNWYVFMGHETRLVGRDIFLDGNTVVPSHRVDRELVVGDIQLGLAFHSGRMRFAVSNVMRTKEFSQQRSATRYGSISFTYYY